MSKWTRDGLEPDRQNLSNSFASSFTLKFSYRGIGGWLVNPVAGSPMVPPGVSLGALY